MRNIEKGLLLAEYFNIDTSKNVPAFINWIENTPQYKVFLAKKNELRYKNGHKAKKIYSLFKQINVKKIKSIKDGFILYGRINYLLKICHASYMINPLIVAYLENKETTIGEIEIDFDAKKMTLDEFVSLEGYSFDFKKEVIQKYIQNWEIEAEEVFVQPIQNIKRNKFYIPPRHIFSFSRTIEFIYIVLLSIFLVIARFLPFETFKSSIQNGCTSLGGYFFYLLVSFTACYLIVFMVIFFYRIKSFYAYNKAYKVLQKDFSLEIMNVKDKLEKYILSKVSSKKKMDEKIDHFNSLSKYYPSLNYFLKRIKTKQIIKSDYVTLAEKIGFIITLVMLISFIIICLLK